jgi:hypothetical protein
MSVLSTSSVLTHNPGIEDKLFWIPLADDIPIIEEGEVWTEKQAFEYALEELMGINDVTVRNILMERFEDIMELVIDDEDKLENIKIPASDSGKKKPGGQPLPSSIMKKIDIFKRMGNYLWQYKYPGFVTPTVWQKAITNPRYKFFRFMYGREIVLKDDTVKYFHPIHRKYYTLEQLESMGQEAYQLPKTPKTYPVTSKVKEEPPVSKIPEKPLSKLFPNANYSPQESFNPSFQAHDNGDASEMSQSQYVLHNEPPKSMIPPYNQSHAHQVNMEVLQFQRTMKRDKANYLDLSSDDYWEPYH